MTQRAGFPAIPLPRPSMLPPGQIPTATPASPTDGPAPAVSYGRLTNPDLLVAVGQWVKVQSTFLWAIRFVPYAEDADAPVRSSEQQVGDLYLEFVNGFIGQWQGRTYQDYRGYLSAPSKGKFHGSRPWYHGPYITIRQQLYRGAQLAARIRANG